MRKEIFNKFISHNNNTLIYDKDKLTFYIDFCLNNHNPALQEKENHHILPKSMFPEFKKLSLNPWNKSTLSIKNHIKAHFYLTEAISHHTQIFAFNQMRRGLTKINNQEDLEELSILYESKRKDIALAISRSNKNKQISDNQKEFLSNFFKDTAVYRYQDGTRKRLPTNHPDVINNLCVFICTERKHKDSTKEYMSNLFKNRKQVFNTLTNEFEYINEGEPLHEYHIIKKNPKKVSRGNSFKGQNFFYDETGKIIRSNVDLTKLGLTKGRNNFGKDGNYFSNKVKVFNILDPHKTLIWKQKDNTDKFDVAYNAKCILCINSEFGLKVSYSAARLKQYLKFDNLEYLLSRGTVSTKVSDTWLKTKVNQSYIELGFKAFHIKETENIHLIVQELVNCGYEWV